MRTYIFNYEQEQALKLGLGVRELLILDYLQRFVDSGTMNKKLIDGKMFYLVAYRKVLSDLPILRIQERQLRNIFRILAERKIIAVKNETAYYLYININKLLLCWKNFSETCREFPQYNKLNYIKIKYNKDINKKLHSVDKLKFMSVIREELKKHLSQVTFECHFNSNENFKVVGFDAEGATFFFKNETVKNIHKETVAKAFNIVAEKYARGETL